MPIRTATEYDNDLHSLNPHVVRLGAYTGVSTKMLHRCACGHEWLVSGSEMLRRVRACRECQKRQFTKERRLTTKAYRAKLVAMGSSMRPTQKYAGCHHPITHRCNRCNFVKRVEPETFISNGARCFSCSYAVRAKTSYARRKFKLAGEYVYVQGYEHHALRYLLSLGTQASNLKVGGDVPRIAYEFTGKARLHFPDIFNEETNTLFEVKSVWTLLGRRERWLMLKAKCFAALAAGYTYQVLVFNRKGTLLALPTDWLYRPRRDVWRALRDHHG